MFKNLVYIRAPCYGRGTDPSDPLGQIFHHQFRCWASETVVVGGTGQKGERAQERDRGRRKAGDCLGR